MATAQDLQNLARNPSLQRMTELARQAGQQAIQSRPSPSPNLRLPTAQNINVPQQNDFTVMTPQGGMSVMPDNMDQNPFKLPSKQNNVVRPQTPFSLQQPMSIAPEKQSFNIKTPEVQKVNTGWVPEGYAPRNYAAMSSAEYGLTGWDGKILVKPEDINKVSLQEQERLIKENISLGQK